MGSCLIETEKGGQRQSIKVGASSSNTSQKQQYKQQSLFCLCGLCPQIINIYQQSNINHPVKIITPINKSVCSAHSVERGANPAFLQLNCSSTQMTSTPITGSWGQWATYAQWATYTHKDAENPNNSRQPNQDAPNNSNRNTPIPTPKTQH